MIIGVTGSYCSGKDAVAEYLAGERGFGHVSLSDVLREDMRARGIEPTRENLIREGAALRRSAGDGVLAVRALARMDAGRDWVVTSMRHPGEIDVLAARGGFTLVFVDAPQAVRFQRMRRRGRPGDPETLAAFIEAERRESQTSGPGQQLAVCRDRADVTLINDFSDLPALHRAVEAMLSGFKGDPSR